jgi:two-component system, OmpR family, response regulator
MRGKVMIIDDNEAILKIVTTVLSGAGCDVSTRNVAVGSTVALMRERPDVALVDVNMPLLEGDELVRSIRKRTILHDIIVLLYSSLSPEELQQRAAACGADGFIPKSMKGADLVAEVARWVEIRHRRQQQSATQSATAPSSAP